jgi:hypothetical protein
MQMRNSAVIGGTRWMRRADGEGLSILGTGMKRLEDARGLVTPMDRGWLAALESSR